jgi:uncharacterized OB-fold protein
MSGGVIYTETAVYAAPEAYVSEAPYQIAIVALDEGGKVTGRIRGEAVVIGDRVELLESAGGVPVFGVLR